MVENMNKLTGKRIILAIDFLDLQDALHIIDDCLKYLSAIKIGNLFLYQNTYASIDIIKKQFDIPVICDFKLMDIPIIAKAVIRLGVENGMDGAMIWGLSGKQTIKECIKYYKDTMIIVVTEFTHTSEIIDHKISNRLCLMAKELGAYGIQAPATKANRIKELKEIVKNDMIIISCGVGVQGAQYGSAIKYGADFEIIGRAICDSHKPALEAEKAYKAVINR